MFEVGIELVVVQARLPELQRQLQETDVSRVRQPRAVLGIDAPQDARPLITRFEEIWATGEPGLTATTLGL